MTGSARAVVEAKRAIAQRNLQAVADLDVELAAADPGDTWFREAVKLRIDWRNSVSNPELKQTFAEQAWQILDLAIANEIDQDFAAMRLVSAAQAGRHNEVIQSVRGYILALEFQIEAVEDGHISPGTVEINLKTNQLEVITRLVNESLDISQANSITRKEINDKLTDAMQRLAQIKQAI